jgi:hypothetical protein
MAALRWAVLTLSLIASTPARAAWLRAETKHFIVYDNAREAEVRALASDLERFDGFIRLFHAASEVPGAESNKLTVYVVSDVEAVQRLCGKCPNVAGFYEGRASGSLAFTPKRTGGDMVKNANLIDARPFCSTNTDITSCSARIWSPIRHGSPRAMPSSCRR